MLVDSDMSVTAVHRDFDRISASQKPIEGSRGSYYAWKTEQDRPIGKEVHHLCRTLTVAFDGTGATSSLWTETPSKQWSISDILSH